jgi:hypothetical protein
MAIPVVAVGCAVGGSGPASALAWQCQRLRKVVFQDVIQLLPLGEYQTQVQTHLPGAGDGYQVQYPLQ